jgi:ATP-binding cassette subfamily F protein uup
MPQAKAKEEKPRTERTPREKRKLSFKEKRELASLPQSIEALEGEKAAIIAALCSPECYGKGDPARLNATSARLEALEKELHEAYRRWEELDLLATKYSP